MSKFKKILSKLFNCVNYVNPICDGFLYDDNYYSFCGGTLSDKTLLLVTNVETELIELIKKQTEIENVELIVDNFTNKTFSTLEPADCDHILNVLFLEDDYSCLNYVYSLLQLEADFAIEKPSVKGITNIFICKNKIVLDSLSGLIRGLGKVLGNHGIIINGIITNSFDIKKTLPTSIFLSSKYGQVLDGEIIEFIEN